MKWLTIFLLFPINLFSQINIHKAGDGWDLKVREALRLIQTTSPTHYTLVEEVVQEIEFWNNSYSSNFTDNEKGVIVIAGGDVTLGINNIAAVIVHESYHLKVLKLKQQMYPSEEEYQSYKHELEFLKLLPNVENFLVIHCIKQMANNSK